MQNSSQFLLLPGLFFGVASFLIVSGVLVAAWMGMQPQSTRHSGPEVDTTWLIEVPFQPLLEIFDNDQDWLKEHRATFSLQGQKILIIDQGCRGWFGWYNHEAFQSVRLLNFRKRFYNHPAHEQGDEMPDFLALQQDRWSQLERHFREEYGEADPHLRFQIEQSVA